MAATVECKYALMIAAFRDLGEKLKRSVEERDELADLLADWTAAADRAGVPDELEDKPESAFGFLTATIAELEADNARLAEKRKVVPLSVDRGLYYDRWKQAEARILELEMMEPKEAHLLAVSEATIADLKRIIGHQEQALVETDEALHGAEATIERLTWMLNESVHGSAIILCDLERRWEERDD